MMTAKGWEEGRQISLEEVRAEDGQPGGGQLTESRVDQMEGGARMETGDAWSRRSPVGPRPQSRWWPMQEPTEGGAMEEECAPTPWGRPMAAEQVEPEEATESRRARVRPKIRRAKAEPEALATEV